MSNLEPGCLAEVIKSVENASVGKIVQCVRMDGIHSLYGEMWWIHCKDILVTEFGGIGNYAHSPASWLRKLEPGESPGTKTTTKEDDLIKSE